MLDAYEGRERDEEELEEELDEMEEEERMREQEKVEAQERADCRDDAQDDYSSCLSDASSEVSTVSEVCWAAAGASGMVIAGFTTTMAGVVTYVAYGVYCHVLIDDFREDLETECADDYENDKQACE